MLGRFLQWLVDRVTELLDFVRSIPNLRFITIAATAILILAIVARIVMVRRLRDEARRAGRAAGSSGVPRADRWAEALRLAELGRFVDAVHTLYAAVIEDLAATQSIRLHSSKTSGDYARELRMAGSPIAARFGAFGRRVDRAIYGLRECTAEDFDTLLRDARPLLESRSAA